MRLHLILLLVFVTNRLSADPVIPGIDAPMKAHLRSIFTFGQTIHNRASVFAKVGDSITDHRDFLLVFGCGEETLASFRYLGKTLRYFRATEFPPAFANAWCDHSNSFTRDSIAAFHGWTAADALMKFANPLSACPAPNDDPLHCELRRLKPSIALIMFGTNDLETMTTAQYRKYLTSVITETMIDGVIPVISTIPPRQDNSEMGRRVAPFNAVVRQIASLYQIPLWDYWEALQDPNMINHGMDAKGIHPSTYNGHDSGTFTVEALRYGFNVRNLTAAQILRKLKAMILADRAPDENTSPNFSLSLDQMRYTAPAGATLAITIHIVRENLSLPQSIGVRGIPSGVSHSFKGDADGKSILILSIESGTASGDYRITIRGASGTLVRKLTFALKIP